jgi:hypothetical protein
MKSLRGDRGATTVEWAFIAPILFLMLFASADISLVIAASSSGSNAAREGARVGSVAYLDADDDDASPSTTYQAIEDRVLDKLGMVKSGSSIVVDVNCLDGATKADIPCDENVVVDEDLIEVKVTWSPIKFSGFISSGSRSDSARMVIVNDGDASLPSGPPAGSGQVSIPAATSVTETDSDQVITITLTRTSSSGSGAVTWTASENSATEPEDYTPVNGVATFVDGSASATFDITIVGDDIVEGTHDFSIALSNPINVTINSAAQAGTVTITDDDVAATPPQLIALEMRDVDGNGKVDRIDARFDETLGSCAGGWTLGGSVPSGGTAGSVTIAGSEARLTINEGGSDPDTAVGSLVVTIPAGSVCDPQGTGNAAIGPLAPADFAAPVLWDVDDTGGSTDGLAQQNDSLRLRFSEALNSATVPSPQTVTITDPNGGGNDNDTLTITNILSGTVALNGQYVNQNNRSATFANSTVALVDSDKSIRITLVNACTGTGCGNLIAGLSASVQFTAVNSIAGTDGRTVTGTVTKTNFRLF